MRRIALNGFCYPIDKWLSQNIETPYYLNWTNRKADRLSNTINEPTILVGFSDGATAALRIALTNPWVKEVYAHSPGKYKGPIIESPNRIQLFNTIGDKTPTFLQTMINYDLFDTEELNVYITRLVYKDFSSPNFLERVVLSRLGHVFHNCLSHLPQEFLK